MKFISTTRRVRRALTLAGFFILTSHAATCHANASQNHSHAAGPTTGTDDLAAEYQVLDTDLLDTDVLDAAGGAFFGAHRVEGQGPWFEGWYSRFHLPDQRASVAVIVGSILAEGQSFTPQERLGEPTGLPGYVAVLLQQPGKPLVVYERFPQKTNILDKEGGNWPSQDPIFGESPSFYWTDNQGTVMTETTIEVNFADVGLQFRAQWQLGRQWSAFGPAQALTMFRIFPLHWYVESLDAPTTVEWHGPEGSFQASGTVHLEKNWGKTFPSRWVWVQGASEQDNLRVSLAGGFNPLEAEGLLDERLSRRLGDRIWALGINSDEMQFRLTPLEAIFRAEIEPCQHRFQLEAWHGLNYLRLNLSSAARDFSAIHVPTKEGFKLGASESFVAKGSLLMQSAFRGQTEWPLEGFALEFGGAYQCAW